MFDMAKQGFDFVDGLPQPWSWILKLVIGIVAAGVVLYKTILYVPQDHKGIKLRFGKVVFRDGDPIIYGPGIHIVVPFTHSLEQVDSRERVIRLKTETASTFFVAHKQSRPGGLNVPISITVDPVNVHAWRYQSEDVENRLTDIAVTYLSGYIARFNPEVIQTETAEVSASLYQDSHQLIDAAFSRYGGKLIAINIGMSSIPDSQPLGDAWYQMGIPRQS